MRHWEVGLLHLVESWGFLPGKVFFIQRFNDCVEKPITLVADPTLLTADVAKMTSHAIFQYNILAIDDTHNTWTNVIVKMNILRLLGSSEDKEKRAVARPEGPPLRGLRYGGP